MIKVTKLKQSGFPGSCYLLMATLCLSPSTALAASYTTSVFATGTAVKATAPDSVTYGNGSVWVEYSNGAASNNYSGTSSIVQYSTAGAVQNTYSLGGNVDGLKYNPNTGTVWALQNQDGNSQLSVINPTTKAISTYTYTAPVSTTRGFDDVAFIGNSVYLSQTNPVSPSDAVVVRLNNPNPATPISFTTVQTGAGISATDPDSLKSTANGNLVLTGEGDGALTFITNPGTASQAATSVSLSGANGATIKAPDDSVYATATSGTFYVADTTANTVYAINASGLIANSSLFVSVGNEFGSVNPTTGVVTSILSGTGLHGAEFVASPEPASIGMALAGAGVLAFAAYRKRKAA